MRLHSVASTLLVLALLKLTIFVRLRLKCDGTRAETRFRLSAKRTSPFKSAESSVQSTTGSRGVRISGSNAGYTQGSVKSTGYPLHSPVSPSLPLPCVTVCHHLSIVMYRLCTGYSFCSLKYPNCNALSRGCLWSTASAPNRWSPGLRWCRLLGLGLVKPSTSMEMASRSTSLWPITSTLDAPLQKKLVKAAVESTHNCCLLWIIPNTFVYTFTARGTAYWQIVGAFAELWKATISILMRVYLSIRLSVFLSSVNNSTPTS